MLLIRPPGLNTDQKHGAAVVERSAVKRVAVSAARKERARGKAGEPIFDPVIYIGEIKAPKRSWTMITGIR